ncbi:thioredoxin reductase [Pseudomonas moraviensis]|uniref:Thioredoxin reductase n=1 Tax=Pseudomonas moraviensis TaxID=321662 RepID=A0A423NQD5_9PSED|nr:MULTISPECIES: cytochrome b/b6 domain-containing protein [Pseudomonas]MDH2077352.1 cytochrome b/b6 domain-containing protein [Pseudomonas atacamensis]MDR6162225.1 thiosulfate reductase cytochrome b subunit [Pseudomonas fluorescens]QXH70389.1 cytochrome b/b6 domain-containing protein [Pseudomonas atacamensis]ROO00465.1 thioredoxin reductase [Pseudomonas moraviensis]UST71897.1 cytochrome b/b6 domain-containing protein [Pseudomonas moraviensis]
MRQKKLHPWPVRLTHWLNAACMVCMFMSGWAIYNASPLFSFRFPVSLTVGGWLGGALAWHFAFMWLLLINGAIYVLYGLASRHFKRELLPIGIAALKHDLTDALRFRLVHEKGVYNAVQRLMYWIVLAAGVLIVISGVAIWKPVQLQELVALLGSYDVARYVHFAAMAMIAAFVVIHLVLVILVPKTLVPMITGGVRTPNNEKNGS